MATQIIHKSEIKTYLTMNHSRQARRFLELADFYAKRNLPGDGRICRQYRRAFSAQTYADAGLVPGKTFLYL